ETAYPVTTANCVSSYNCELRIRLSLKTAIPVKLKAAYPVKVETAIPVKLEAVYSVKLETAIPVNACNMQFRSTLKRNTQS
ncbi:hypothetical protein Tco_0920759, partial [Tanacetum coccineum]